MEWVPVVFITFKLIVFGTGMFFAIKWHYDQDMKKKNEAKKQQDNNADFLRSAPPGTPSEFPDESVAQRKARTRIQSPLDKKLEAKKAAAEKVSRRPSRWPFSPSS